MEVLLALALFAMAMTALTESFSNILLTLQSMKVEVDRQGVVRFVRSQVISLPDRADFEAGGSISTLDAGEANWRAVIEPMEVVDLFRVRLRIELNPPGGRESEVHEEVFYLLRPTWSDPVDRSILISNSRDRVLRDRQNLDWR